MKRSIKKQIMGVFVILIIVMIAVLFVVNVSFLGSFYVQNKQKDLQNVYETLSEGAKDGTITSDSMKNKIENKLEKSNIAVIVIDSNNEVVLTSEKDVDWLKNQLMGYIFGKNEHQTMIKQTDDYSLVKSVDRMNSREYLEMIGKLDGDYTFILRSPLESIRESVNLSNQFLIYVGVAICLISVLFGWYFSKKITDPIQELANLSDKMADLDFNAKYSSGGENEIGVLGENFNRMSEKLEETISELKRANFELQQDIEKKDKVEKMRTEFLANVSHELKTPIALVQGYAEGLKEGITDDPESMEFYCDVIMDEADKMNKMVRNLLALNQLEFGNEEVEFERFNLVELVRGVVSSNSILIEQKDVTMNFNPPEEVYVWADEFKVEQVVRNYISNAFNHVDGDKLIEIKILTEGDKAKVTVFNTGTPIPEEDLEHIWDKFYKVDKARTREYGGNGIGLSIVKAIMSAFHQNYGVKNYENGVEFWFELDMK